MGIKYGNLVIGQQVVDSAPPPAPRADLQIKTFAELRGQQTPQQAAPQKKVSQYLNDMLNPDL